MNLINGGIEVQDGEVSIQFVVNGDATSQRHLCQVDREPRRQCLSKLFITFLIVTTNQKKSMPSYNIIKLCYLFNFI